MQNDVLDFIFENKLTCGAKNRYIDVVSEVGELGKELLLSCEYMDKDITKTSKMEEEMGDVLFSLLALCCELSIDSKEALDKSLAKYKRRLLTRNTIGSGE